MIGGGYIGLELGSVWARLGAKVTVVEYLDRILPGMDRELGPAMQRHPDALRHGVQARHQGRRRRESATRRSRWSWSRRPAASARRLAADVVLVAIGRRPFTEGLGLDEIGVARDRAGRVEVDEDFATNVPGIYAIGDVIRGPMLAHKAEEEGIAVRRTPRRAEDACRLRRDPRRSSTRGPKSPAVGKTEDELKAAGDRLPGRQIPVHRQCAGADQRRYRRLRQGAGRRGDRPGARACTSSAPMPGR